MSIKKIITIIYFIILVVGALLGYLVTSFKENILTDGLGRKLYDSPKFLKYIWNNDYWAGFYWLMFDMVYLFGGICFLVFVLWKDKK